MQCSYVAASAAASRGAADCAGASADAAFPHATNKRPHKASIIKGLRLPEDKLINCQFVQPEGENEGIGRPGRAFSKRLWRWSAEKPLEFLRRGRIGRMSDGRLSRTGGRPSDPRNARAPPRSWPRFSRAHAAVEFDGAVAAATLRRCAARIGPALCSSGRHDRRQHGSGHSGDPRHCRTLPRKAGDHRGPRRNSPAI
jgi:hypothetical protein